MRRSQAALRRLSALASTARTAEPASLALTWAAAGERQLSSRTASTSGGSGASRLWPLAAIPVLGGLAAATVAADSKDAPYESEGFHLLPLASRQRIFFKYEKRVRDKSTLDKVFEYFASQDKDKHKFMLPVDLLRAIVPTYPPSESQSDRSGSLDGERASGRPQPFWSKAQTSFFKQFDVDGDGLISYPEFLLVLTLLSIHEKDVQTIFDVVDLDGNGAIDAEEFRAVMELLQAMANVHAAKVGRSHRLSIDTESGILISFFGRDGRKKLSLAEFADFLSRLHEEVVKLEWAHYDCNGRGSLAAVDFARSVVATADVRHVDRLLDQVDAMPAELLRKRVSFDDFAKVAAMQRKLHTLSVALDFLHHISRPISKADFAKLLKKLINVTLSPHVLDILFAVFGDARGNLDTPTFLEVMQRREIMWARRKVTDVDGYAPGTLGRALACTRKCFSSEE